MQHVSSWSERVFRPGDEKVSLILILHVCVLASVFLQVALWGFIGLLFLPSPPLLFLLPYITSNKSLAVNLLQRLK